MGHDDSQLVADHSELVRQAPLLLCCRLRVLDQQILVIARQHRHSCLHIRLGKIASSGVDLQERADDIQEADELCKLQADLQVFWRVNIGPLLEDLLLPRLDGLAFYIVFLLLFLYVVFFDFAFLRLHGLAQGLRRRLATILVRPIYDPGALRHAV